ncbi:MAG TPA: glutaminyl-peptide cyclotransferase [Chitinophagaceae bacterium]|jgi:glutamine cyclotransferase
MKYLFRYLMAVPVIYFLLSCRGNAGETTTTAEENNTNPAPPMLSYNIVKVYPHDTASFTEGLFLHDNALYESTGLEGQSKLRKINVETGKPEKEIKLDSMQFGEGISMIGNNIYQLTYTRHTVFVYDATTFKKIKEMTWPFEGWGMTTNGKELIISTGGSNLYFVTPDSFRITKQVNVTDNYGPVGNINELEYVNGTIYANLYKTNYILKIDPETGKVTGKLDLTGILDKSSIPYDPRKYDENSGNVLNGIAFDSSKNSLYVTGKYWPALFEIKLN